MALFLYPLRMTDPYSGLPKEHFGIGFIDVLNYAD
jgi:hypothetical protein